MYSVMIVLNDELSRRALKVMVNKCEGFETVCSASTGEEAVEICRTRNIDIIFLEMVLDGKSGIDYGKIIRDNNPNIEINIMSAFYDFRFVVDVLDINVKRYLYKPVSFSMVRCILNEYKCKRISKDTHISKLSHLLSEHRYRDMALLLPEIVDEVFSDVHGDIASKQNKMLYIGEQLLRLIHEDEDKTNKRSELFPINVVYAPYKIYWVFWLYDVMDYIFQRKAAQMYDVFDSVCKCINQNINDDVCLRSLTEMCHISQTYLSKLFQQLFGISVMEYIHLKKLKKAKMYFVFTDMNINDVAYSLGYNESSYFSRVFKKYENMTIVMYKNKIKSDMNLSAPHPLDVKTHNSIAW